MIRRPVIAPGLPVLTDSAGVVHVGLAHRDRLRLPGTPALRRALAILARGEALPVTRENGRARALLEPVLRDGDSLHRPGFAAADVAAVSLAHPSTTPQRLAAREKARIAVVGDLGIDFRTLLAAVGLNRQVAPSSASVVLSLSRGEPARDAYDDLARAGTPYLVVRAVEAEIIVGPFVVPGRTACLRCCDLHREDHEPGYGTLLRAAIQAPRKDGVPTPIDTALGWIALGTAVGDLVRYAEGDRPVSWSTTIHLDPTSTTPGAPGANHWPPHPDCSCSWVTQDLGVDRSVTMGA